MRKHLFGLVLTLLVAVSALLGTVTAEAAGNFVQVADTGVLELKSNQKWEKEYRTKMGDVKIRFRNLANSKENKRYHLIIWWRDPGSKYSATTRPAACTLPWTLMGAWCCMDMIPLPKNWKCM